jgi:ATP-dependent Clp protease adapter protein ClpS
MIALGFIIGALAVGLVLYLPFFLWFRFRRPKASRPIALDVEVSLHMAFVAARRLRYETISLEQLLLALLDNPCAAAVLRSCAVDIEAMRAEVSAIVRDSTPVAPGTGSVEPVASPELQRVLQRAIARVLALRRSPGQRPDVSRATPWVPALLRKSAGRPTVDGGDVLAALLEEPGGAAVDELQRHGVTRLAVTHVISHGSTDTDPIAANPPQVDGTASMAIVLENDDFTPMEFVVDVLQEHLGLTRESAVRVMLQVHHEGRAIAGRFPVDVSMDKAERLRAAARQAGHPFRCVVASGSPELTGQAAPIRREGS